MAKQRSQGLRFKQPMSATRRRTRSRQKVGVPRRPCAGKNEGKVEAPPVPVSSSLASLSQQSTDAQPSTITDIAEIAASLEAAPQPVLRPILRRAQGPAATCFPTPRNEGPKRVHFKTKISVHEYTRLVGGSCCVPQDGSTLALGLGKLMRTTTEAESPKRRKASRNCGEDLDFMPVAQRERLLKASEAAQIQMGGSSASVPSKAEWKAHREELRDLQKSRALELENAINWQPMPDSEQKASLRAQKLALSLGRGKAVSSTASPPRKSRGKAPVSVSPMRQVRKSSPVVMKSKLRRRVKVPSKRLRRRVQRK